MDLFTLIPLVIALVVFWKLRSVLGTRTGHERPPMDPYAADRRERTLDHDDGPSDNVITLPGSRNRDNVEAEMARQADEMIARHTENNRKAIEGLKAIAARDRNFDLDQFVSGAKMAYEMIVTAFADGDRKALKGLLSREVYDNFCAAIDERESRSERLQSSFVGIEKAMIADAELNADEAHVTVRFVSQIISATINAKGEVVDGDENEVAEVTDVWTFARSVRSRDPNWKLVATDD